MMLHCDASMLLSVTIGALARCSISSCSSGYTVAYTLIVLRYPTTYGVSST